MDLNEPITNNELKQAIAAYRKDNSPGNEQKLLIALKSANFLTIVYNDEMEVTHNAEGNTTIKQGSLLKFHLLIDNNDHTIFPLFTDWDEIKLLVKMREGIGGVVMPTDQAFAFILSESIYFGAVINPMSDNWMIGRPQLTGFLNIKIDPETLS